jgi:hypothetical protein
LGQNRTCKENQGESRCTTNDESMHIPILHVTDSWSISLCTVERPKGQCLHVGSWRSQARPVGEPGHTSPHSMFG